MKCRLHLPQNPVDNMLVQGWRELACKDGSKAYEGQPPASSYLYLRLDGVFCSRRRSPRRQGQRPRGGVRGEGLEGYITLRNHTCSRLKCPKTCALPSRIEEVLTEAGGVHLATPKQRSGSMKLLPRTWNSVRVVRSAHRFSFLPPRRQNLDVCWPVKAELTQCPQVPPLRDIRRLGFIDSSSLHSPYLLQDVVKGCVAVEKAPFSSHSRKTDRLSTRP
jgi:hypothetical protein